MRLLIILFSFAIADEKCVIFRSQCGNKCRLCSHASKFKFIIIHVPCLTNFNDVLFRS